MKQHILDGIQSTHDIAADTLVKISPLLAPVPSAIAIYMALHESFGIIGASTLALAVEGLGFAMLRLMMRAIVERGWHRDGKVLIAAAGMSIAVYFGAVFAIIGLLPHNEAYAMAARAFPFLTLVGASAAGLEYNLNKAQTAGIDSQRAVMHLRHEERLLKIEEQAARKAVSQSVPNGTVHASSTSGGASQGTDKAGTVAAYFRDNPGASIRDAAAATGLSKSTVQRYKPQ